MVSNWRAISGKICTQYRPVNSSLPWPCNYLNALCLYKHNMHPILKQYKHELTIVIPWESNIYLDCCVNCRVSELKRCVVAANRCDHVMCSQRFPAKFKMEERRGSWTKTLNCIIVKLKPSCDSWCYQRCFSFCRSVIFVCSWNWSFLLSAWK